MRSFGDSQATTGFSVSEPGLTARNLPPAVKIFPSAQTGVAVAESDCPVKLQRFLPVRGSCAVRSPGPCTSTSSTPAFLEALAPRAALLSCGRNNRFGHPALQTLASLSRLRIPVFRTDLRSDVGFALTRDHLFLFERGVP